MNELLAYLNSLDKARRAAFCNAVGTTEGYLRKSVSAGSRFKAELCVLIERHAEGQVTRKQLRSDWPKVWPELYFADRQLWAIPQAEWAKLLKAGS